MPLGHPSVTPWPPLSHPLVPGMAGTCQTRSFPFCFASRRDSISRTYSSVFIYLSFTREGRGQKPIILMRNYLTLSCRIRYCMTQRLFGSTSLKMSCRIKTAEEEKARADFRQVSSARSWRGLRRSFSFSPSVTSPFSSPALRQHPRQLGSCCSLGSKPPRVTSANTHRAFKRVGKGILERDN